MLCRPTHFLPNQGEQSALLDSTLQLVVSNLIASCGEKQHTLTPHWCDASKGLHRPSRHLQPQQSPGQESVHGWQHHHCMTCCQPQSAHHGLASAAQHFLALQNLPCSLQESAASCFSLRLAAVWACPPGWGWGCAEPLPGLSCTAARHTHTCLRSADHTLLFSMYSSCKSTKTKLTDALLAATEQAQSWSSLANFCKCRCIVRQGSIQVRLNGCMYHC